MAYSYVNDKDEALDVVQDAVYKAYISIKKLKNPEFFTTWLTRIVINSALNSIKKSKKIVYIDEYTNDAGSDDLKEIEDSMDLHTAINSLDDKYKTIVLLKFFEDRTLEDISQILNLPLSTVKSRLYRALNKLKLNLKEAENFE
ncbi:hypothetical protein SH2C18_25750 [Clostridium sediminicola]